MRGGLLLIAGLSALMIASATSADVKVTQKGSRVFMENANLLIEFDAAGGARITRLLDKAGGADMIAWWKGSGEIGGALDDRLFFTSARYRTAIVRPGPDVGRVRFEATHPSGVEIVKSVQLERDGRTVRVDYTFKNGAQKPYRLWVRNFIIPGGGPLSDAHLYWLPASARPAAEGKSFVNGRFPEMSAPWAALWHRKTGAGILAVVPGLQMFYFWQGSREFPTFEWAYPELPAGKSMTASLVLVVVHAAEPPDWAGLAKEAMPGLGTVWLADIPEWVDEASRFNVTDEERKRGFWLSIGMDDGKQRLPELLELDLAQDDGRAIYVGINVLKDLSGVPVRAAVEGLSAEHVKACWESTSKDKISLEPLSEQEHDLAAGVEYRLWLDVDARGLSSGRHEALLRLGIAGNEMRVPIRITIWDVPAPGERPFHVRGYCGGFATIAGSYDVDEASLKRLDAMLAAYAGMGGDVLDWTVNWASILKHVKIAGTDDIVATVAKEKPGTITPDHLPELNFSYYDPWIAVAKRHGITRIETYMMPLNRSKWQWMVLDQIAGKGKVKFDTAQSNKVIAWLYSELRRYFDGHGLSGFFCKIADEIAPERIPDHIATAKVARAAGWRPFTTITGPIARTATHINEMNPYCDEWQLSMVLKDDFLRLLRDRYRLVKKRVTLDRGWGAYRNGGARHTWATRTFGEDSLTGDDPASVENLCVFEDGKPLELSGGSAWGNQRAGVAFTCGALGPWIYVAPTDGTDPAEGRHRYEVEYTVRVPDPGGKPLARIDADDEVWFYGGRSSPFRTRYEESAVYPLLAFALDMDGFGWWAFCRWQPTENIVWFDPDSGTLTVGPAYLGLRDGYRDARLLASAKRRAAGRDAAALQRIISESDHAVLRIEYRTREAYHFRTITTATSPARLNEARRMALQLLADGVRR